MGNGCYGCGGVPIPSPYPVATPVNIGASRFPGNLGPSPYGGFGDADPITPGIQTRPGVVSAVGPSRIVGGPGPYGRPGYYASMVRPI